jgi:hypothetical protein
VTTTEVILSDGKPCRVRRLGIFELDGVGPALVGPFRYTFKLANGQEVEEEYDISSITRPPQHPGVPEHEIEERSPQWWALLEWQTYKSAVEHERKRIESINEYVRAVSAHIARHAVSETDRKRVIDSADWQAIYEAALVPQITVERLRRAFDIHFGAHFKGEDIFDALQKIERGHGGYDSIRATEIQIMQKMGMTEAQWAELSIEERTRHVAARMLPKLVENLESDQSIKEARRRALQNRG